MLKKTPVQIVLVAFALILLNWIVSDAYIRLDVTKDKRYTLSETTERTLREVVTPIKFDIFLKGDFPVEFKKLQFEIQQMLEQYRAENDNVVFEFINPLEGEENPDQVINYLNSLGMPPTNIPTTENGKKTLTQIFPWAIANYGSRSVRVPLLVNNMSNNAQENINYSVQQLEYNFTDAITKLTTKKNKKIAILKGNGELDDKYMSDFLINLKEYYRLGKFDFDSLQNDPQKVLRNLENFDAAIVAKPTEEFSDVEKQIMDQYIMNGGKVLWCLDKVSVDLDSLQNETQSTVAFPRQLNLDDMLFKYGVRLNYNLVEDLVSTPISVQGENGIMPLEWFYSPIIISPENHIINKNVNVVKLEFTNQIDVLKNDIKKTTLLQTSPQSKVVGAPVQVKLDQFMGEPDPQQYAQGPQVVGVLLEGSFTSVFKNRVKPFKLDNVKDDGLPTKMIVISDGDIINYTYTNKKPLVNGIDPWTQQVYGNKDFLINCINYLLDDKGLINIRGKEIKLAYLDHEKIENEKSLWILINIGVPLLLLAVFGAVFYILRKRKYAK